MVVVLGFVVVVLRGVCFGFLCCCFFVSLFYVSIFSGCFSVCFVLVSWGTLRLRKR